MQGITEQADRAGDQRDDQLHQAGGSEAEGADADGPIGLSALVGVIEAANRVGRLAQSRDLVHETQDPRPALDSHSRARWARA